MPKVCKEEGCNEFIERPSNNKLGYCRIHRKKHQARKWRKENPELAKVKSCLDSRKYRERHPEYQIKSTERNRKWRNKNRERVNKLGREQMRKYIKAHPEYVEKRKIYVKQYKAEKMKDKEYKKKVYKRTRDWRNKIRIEAFFHYSNGDIKCNLCGFRDIRGLCLDHINNDGGTHRRSLCKNKLHYAGNSVGVYFDVKKRGYPDGFQVLCFNCNRIKEYERTHPI